MIFDVAVVGASVAGLHAAGELARAGKRVAVFERHSHPSPARRTLIVTPAIRSVLGGLPRRANGHYIRRITVASLESNATVLLNDPDPIVERSELIAHLADRAVGWGAQIHYGFRFTGFLPARGLGVKVAFQRGTRMRPVLAREGVVGADGVLTDVGPAAGLPRPPAVPILQAETELPNGWDSGLTQVWFDVANTRYFHWMIPQSSTRAVVGLIGERASRMRGLLEGVLRKLQLNALGFQGAFVALYHPRLQVWNQVDGVPVFLVGEAAGQVKVTTVGGTVSGLLGAEAVARSIVSKSSYPRELKRLNRELNIHWWIRRLLDRLDNNGYNRLLQSVTPGVRGFLSRHNRDSMAGVLWRLPFLEPRLLVAVMQGVLGANKVGPAEAGPSRTDSSD